MHRPGLFGWFYKNLRGKKGQQGFTLIELLVVVTILGVLAGIVTLSLVGLTTNASVQSCNSEYKTVQAALDAFMAANNVEEIFVALVTKPRREDSPCQTFNFAFVEATFPALTPLVLAGPVSLHRAF